MKVSAMEFGRLAAGLADDEWYARNRVNTAEAELSAASINLHDTAYAIMAAAETGENVWPLIEEHWQAQGRETRARNELSAARKNMAGMIR